MPSRFQFPRRNNCNRGQNSSSSSSTAGGRTSSVSTVPTDMPSSVIEEHHHHHHHHHHRQHRPYSRSCPTSTTTNTSTTTSALIQNFRLRAIDQAHDECAVCARAFEIDCVVSLLPCNHYFCQDCMMHWFDRMHSTTCPLCRYDLLSSSHKLSQEKEEEEIRVLHNDDILIAQRRNGHHHHDFSSTISVSNQAGITDAWLKLDVSKTTDAAAGSSLGDAAGATSCLSFVEAKASRTAAFSNNFDLIMAKTLHARRAILLQRAYSWNSTISLEDDDD